MPDTPVANINSDPENPENGINLISAFQTLSAEADLLLQRKNFQEAIEVYTKALGIRPGDKHCLVSRSRCFIQIGSPQLALLDADSTLQDNQEFFKGLYQKAEALYAQGDFELALVYYHRGNRLRPEMHEFRIGIQKSREAIENSIGNSMDHCIVVPAALRRNLAIAISTDESSTSRNGGKSIKNEDKSSNSADLITLNLMNAIHSSTLSPGMESKLLTELYEDKLYLKQFLKDRDFIHHPNQDVLELIQEGLRYLHTRTEFWRQQNPLYAREKPEHKNNSNKVEKGNMLISKN
ncbi:Tetratricopeptide repeat protein 25, partial [Nowakowskiella sp. JEL0078]